MSAINYTAKRKLISGHVLATAYDLEFSAKTLDPAMDLINSANVALDGTTEAVLDRIDDRWSITTTFIDQADIPQWKEFFASVAAAESFTFDAYGTVAVPDNIETVLLEGSPSIARVAGLYMYTVSFVVRLVQ